LAVPALDLLVLTRGIYLHFHVMDLEETFHSEMDQATERAHHSETVLILGETVLPLQDEAMH
jgi:hypothetical protein